MCRISSLLRKLAFPDVARVAARKTLTCLDPRWPSCGVSMLSPEVRREPLETRRPKDPKVSPRSCGVVMVPSPLFTFLLFSLTLSFKHLVPLSPSKPLQSLEVVGQVPLRASSPFSPFVLRLVQLQLQTKTPCKQPPRPPSKEVVNEKPSEAQFRLMGQPLPGWWDGGESAPWLSAVAAMSRALQGLLQGVDAKTSRGVDVPRMRTPN